VQEATVLALQSHAPRLAQRLALNANSRAYLFLSSANEAFVLFDNNGEKIEYRLPADLLRKNGVIVADQPFELVESEVTDSSGFALQSKIAPLADATSGTIEPLALTKVYKAKRNFLLRKSK